MSEFLEMFDGLTWRDVLDAIGIVAAVWAFCVGFLAV